VLLLTIRSLSSPAYHNHGLIGAMTRASNGSTQQNGPSAPQRSERPKAVKPTPEKSMAVAMSLSQEDGPESESKGPMGMAAPRAGGNNNNNNRGAQTQMKPKKNEEKDEDDFGDTDVTDLLG
jgi:hypothetical protein